MKPRPLLPESLVRDLVEDGWYRRRTLWDSIREADEQKTAVICPRHGVVTYGELTADSERLAAYWFTERGVRPGEVVILQLPNWYDFILAHVALTRLGAVTLPVIPTLGEGDLRSIALRSEAVGIVYSSEPSNVGVRSYQQILADIGTLRWTQNVSSQSLRHPPVGCLLPAALPDPDEVTVLLATSGTTGEPKLVMHSHRSTVGGLIHQLGAEMQLDPSDVILTTSPVAHAAGLQYGVRLAITLGCTLVLQARWEPEVAADLVRAHGVTWSIGATPFLYDLVNLSDRHRAKLTTLRGYVCGGAPVPESLARTVTHRLPQMKLMRAWGMSETGIVTLVRPEDPADKVASTDGRPVPGWQIRIVDLDTDTLSAPDGVGEIQCRGATLFLGYLGSPEATREAVLPGGWFRTGDLGTIDEDGYLRCVGRHNDRIIRGGLNISATEIEEALVSHPAVADVAVVGVPDERLGERICAVVVAVDKAPTLEDLKDYLVVQGVSKTKLPERLVLMHRLPRSETGKVLKSEVRDVVVKRIESPTEFPP